MIQSIEKYAQDKGISQQDALQVFMQVVALKNLLTQDATLMGGAALVMGHGNPRFSEDIDLTGVGNPLGLRTALTKSASEIGDLLTAKTRLTSPKPGRATWRILCEVRPGLSAQLHVDSQTYKPLTHHPIMVVFGGILPFVFPSIDLTEIMADKLIALAFRNYASGRDIFDLWFHWLRDKSISEMEAPIITMVRQKLSMRKLKTGDFLEKLQSKVTHGISKRVTDEWERYLPRTLQDPALYHTIFDAVSQKIRSLHL